MRSYFIYYSYIPPEGKTIQYRNMAVNIDSISNLDDIRAVERMIYDNARFVGLYITNVTLINWKRFE